MSLWVVGVLMGWIKSHCNNAWWVTEMTEGKVEGLQPSIFPPAEVKGWNAMIAFGLPPPLPCYGCIEALDVGLKRTSNTRGRLRLAFGFKLGRHMVKAQQMSLGQERIQQRPIEEPCTWERMSE